MFDKVYFMTKFHKDLLVLVGMWVFFWVGFSKVLNFLVLLGCLVLGSSSGFYLLGFFFSLGLAFWGLVCGLGQIPWGWLSWA